MNGKARRQRQAGFSLVELMIVMAIIGILAAVAVPNIQVYREKAVVASAINTGHQILNAFSAYAATSPGNRYPAVETMEDVIRVVDENGSILTEKQLGYFRDPETADFSIIFLCCTFHPFKCRWFWQRDDGLGPENFSLLIPIQSIVRSPEETLVLEVSSVEGVQIRTGIPEPPP